jgi:hypothetical protein
MGHSRAPSARIAQPWAFTLRHALVPPLYHGTGAYVAHRAARHGPCSRSSCRNRGRAISTGSWRRRPRRLSGQVAPSGRSRPCPRAKEHDVSFMLSRALDHGLGPDCGTRHRPRASRRWPSATASAVSPLRIRSGLTANVTSSVGWQAVGSLARRVVRSISGRLAVDAERHSPRQRFTRPLRRSRSLSLDGPDARVPAAAAGRAGDTAPTHQAFGAVDPRAPGCRSGGPEPPEVLG